MTAFARPPWDGWSGPSSDPNDEQFGDVVEAMDYDEATEAGPGVVFVGEPYDGAVIGRRGARKGPLAIRRSLAGVETHHFGTGPVGGEATLADLGDVRTADATGAAPGLTDASPGEPADVAAVQERVREVTADVHALDALPVFVGGDNSLTFANAAPLAAEAELGVVNFDAHLDCRALDDGPSSGTPYRQLFEAGLDAYVPVGVRHFETSTAYAEYVADRDGEVVTAESVGEDLDAVLDRIRDALDDVEAVYLSVDVDVLDATAAPGVSAPTPGGLATRELFALVRRLAAAERDRLAGVDVVECAPPLDEGGRTVDAAARTVAHALGGYLSGAPEVNRD